MSNEQLLQAISDMLDGVEERLEQKLEQKLEEKLEQKLEEKLEQKFDEKLQPINNRLDKLESEVSALKAGQTEIRKEIREMSKKVSDTYQLALDAWGVSTENRKWLESSSKMM